MRNLFKTSILGASAAFAVVCLSSGLSAAELIVNNHTGHVVTYIRSDNADWQGVIYPGQSIDVGLYMHDNTCVHRLSAASSSGVTWGPKTIDQCQAYGVARRFQWNLVDFYR